MGEELSRGSHRPVAEASCLHRSVHEKIRAKAYNAVLARLQLPGSGACFYITRPRLTRIGHSAANNRINDHDLDLDGAAFPYSLSSTSGTRRQTRISPAAHRNRQCRTTMRTPGSRCHVKRSLVWIPGTPPPAARMACRSGG